MSLFLALFKNPILEVTSTLAVTLKKFTLGFCPKIFLGVTCGHVTCGEVRKKFWGKNSMLISQGRPIQAGQQNLTGCFEKLKQYLGGLGIFHTSSMCEGVWKIAKPPKNGFSFSKQS